MLYHRTKVILVKATLIEAAVNLPLETQMRIQYQLLPNGDGSA